MLKQAAALEGDANDLPQRLIRAVHTELAAGPARGRTR
jgi:hypothetical protein